MKNFHNIQDWKNHQAAFAVQKKSKDERQVQEIPSPPKVSVQKRIIEAQFGKSPYDVSMYEY